MPFCSVAFRGAEQLCAGTALWGGRGRGAGQLCVGLALWGGRGRRAGCRGAELLQRA